ncbi:MAG: hypothetical protein OXF20_13925 [Gammaproteobacteria bacterium]|nr:hypothetical protein [Gammaproteobacteria bacterium]
MTSKSNQPEKVGQPAALFPALSEPSKEMRAVSILLACMALVPELAKSLLKGHGAPLGKTSKFKAWTEVGSIGTKDGNRPDGKIEIQQGKKTWVALLEAKIGKIDLNEDQIESYLKTAKSINADALITISNEFATLPNHHPSYQKTIPKNIQLLHWSWSSIRTKCRLLHDNKEIDDDAHHCIIEHLIEFLNHSKTGVIGMDLMPSSWKDLNEMIASGAVLKVDNKQVIEVAAAWIQKARDLGLQLTDLVNKTVSMKLTRDQKDKPEKLLNSVCDGLSNQKALEIEYLIPDAVSPMKVRVDLGEKKITTSMSVFAPKDRKSAKSCVSWLVNQLKDKTKIEGVHVMAYFPRRDPLQHPLDDVLEYRQLLTMDDSKMCPNRFEVKLIDNLERKKMGPKVFIQELEKHVEAFYKHVGQHLRPWVPSAPKVAPKEDQSHENSNQSESPKPTLHENPIDSTQQ